MKNPNSVTIHVSGELDKIPASDMAVFRTRINRAIDGIENTGQKVELVLGEAPKSQNQPSTTTKNASNETGENDEDVIKKLAQQYHCQKPLYSFKQLIVPEEVAENLLFAVDAIEVESIVYEEWGLKEIQPYPRTILNFYGPSGTGKTLAAHAIAERLGKQILIASYADIESKYHGEGPKQLKAIFYAAQRDRALLFIDEADSLLSKRLTEVNTGSEQAINSMRSQLLICLEEFEGIVIFATNLVENYDKAFNTRIRHIHFPMPDEKCRREIWQRHFPTKLPLSDDVSVDELAKIQDICGREIREAVIDSTNRAALKAKREGKDPRSGIISLKDLQEAAERKKAERIETEKEKLTPEEEAEVSQKVALALSPSESTNNHHNGQDKSS
ncbi:MAG: ATP-binding protein [Okeania sp. SIO2F4]|uniref:ATP-binding protein n=1 Tax=Okeania sp. SIO2F4 TaxID=2607790 RepID=UPI00142BCD1F|nr:ATP-binding protein [Okeania sp. SIO2F4]NES05684.1 ATP-binding protein [Okeania sp. SIO2F4]